MKKVHGMLVMLCAGIVVAGTVLPGNCFAFKTNGTPAGQTASSDSLVLYDPFDRENPVVKLPGIPLTYTRGYDRGEALQCADLSEPPVWRDAGTRVGREDYARRSGQFPS